MAFTYNFPAVCSSKQTEENGEVGSPLLSGQNGRISPVIWNWSCLMEKETGSFVSACWIFPFEYFWLGSAPQAFAICLAVRISLPAQGLEHQTPAWIFCSFSLQCLPKLPPFLSWQALLCLGWPHRASGRPDDHWIGPLANQHSTPNLSQTTGSLGPPRVFCTILLLATVNPAHVPSSFWNFLKFQFHAAVSPEISG